jgi:hypothetical protein
MAAAMAGLSPCRIEKHENRQTPKSFLRSSEEDSVVSTEFGRNISMNKLSKWEIFYSFLIIVPMAAFMTIGDYILRKRATGN